MVMTPPDAPTEGRYSKQSKEGGQKILNIVQIKEFSFCFLNTDYITPTFHYFIPESIPFQLRVNTFDIPT
jgi:hypothetical protein